MDPAAVLGGNDALGAQHEAVGVHIRELLQRGAQLLLAELVRGLNAEVLEHLVRIVMVMAAGAAMAVVVMMMVFMIVMAALAVLMMVLMVMLVAAALFVMIMVMMVLMVMLVAAALFVMIMVMMMLMVMLMAAAFFIMVMVMMVLVVMLVAAAFFVMIMVMMVLVIMLMAAALFVMIMVMMVLVIVLVAAALFVMIMVMMVLMVVLMIVVMMMAGFRIEFKDIDQGSGALDGIEDLLAGELVPRRGDDARLGIFSLDQLDGLIQLVLLHVLGAGEDDGLGGLDLIGKEFAEILEIHAALLAVDDGRTALEFERMALLGLLDDGADLRELADAGGLDDDAVGRIFGDELVDRLMEIADEGAADAAGIELAHFDASFLHEAAVDADLAVFVFKQDDLFAFEGVGDELFDEGGLAGAEEAGNDGNIDHIRVLLFWILFV